MAEIRGVEHVASVLEAAVLSGNGPMTEALHVEQYGHRQIAPFRSADLNGEHSVEATRTHFHAGIDILGKR